MIPDDEGEGGREVPRAGDETDKYLTAIEAQDPATAVHALAAEFEERAETHARLLDLADPDEDPVEWSQMKGLLDAYRSAAVTARTVALSWSGRDGDGTREEVKK